MNIGKLIQRERNRREFTVPFLAQSSGIGVKDLCDIESGRTVPKRDIIVRIAQSLDMNDYDLLIPAGKIPQQWESFIINNHIEFMKFYNSKTNKNRIKQNLLEN